MKFVTEIDYLDLDAVTEEYPEAAYIIAVEGGWMVFADYRAVRQWLAQR